MLQGVVMKILLQGRLKTEVDTLRVHIKMLFKVVLRKVKKLW
jgi:hypothetical protein